MKTKTAISADSLTQAQRQEIERRAYFLWEHEGRPAGREADHWARAEAEILREQTAIKTPAAKKPATKKPLAKTAAAEKPAAAKKSAAKKPDATANPKPAAKAKKTVKAVKPPAAE